MLPQAKERLERQAAARWRNARIVNRETKMTRRSVLIESLQSTPRDLARLLRPIDAAAARGRRVADEWCIADVVAHLSYCELPYLARLRRVVEQDNPFEPALLPDESAHDL